MILCLDIGNSQIFGGVFDSVEHTATSQLLLRFRHQTDLTITSDQFGVFLRNVLHENNLDSRKITHIAISSVVPPIDYSIRAACKKYFHLDPFVLSLDAATKTGLKNKRLNPTETGADLLACAVAAAHYYPQNNLIVVDLGTATTLTAITDDQELIGVAIMAGMRLSINALTNNTAKLFPVEIALPQKAAGNTTKGALQSGLYYGHLGAIKEIAAQMSAEIFHAHTTPLLIGTGGFAYLFETAKMFDIIKPDLVLDGLRIASALNR